MHTIYTPFLHSMHWKTIATNSMQKCIWMVPFIVDKELVYEYWHWCIGERWVWDRFCSLHLKCPDFVCRSISVFFLDLKTKYSIQWHWVFGMPHLWIEFFSLFFFLFSLFLFLSLPLLQNLIESYHSLSISGSWPKLLLCRM